MSCILIVEDEAHLAQDFDSTLKQKAMLYK